MNSLKNKICSMIAVSAVMFSCLSPGIVSAAAQDEENNSSLNSEAYKARLQKIIDDFDAAMDKKIADEQAARDFSVKEETPRKSEEAAKAPVPQISQGRYSFDWQGTPLSKSLYAVAKIAKKNVVVNGELKGNVYTSLQNVTCEEALNYLSQSFNFNYHIDGNTIIISTSELMLQSAEFPVSYANKEKLVDEIKALGVDEKNVYANMETGTVSVTGTAYQIAEAKRRIKVLDRPVPQVLVLAQLIEINHGKNLDLGFNYTLPTYTHTGTDDSTSRNLPGNVWEKLTFGASVSANKELSKGKVIARPVVMMLNGQQGEVSFGDQVPVLSTTSTTTSTSVTVDYKDVGSKLKIVPIINEELNEVTMTIDTEVSSIGRWRTFGQTSAPQIASRHAVTSAHIKSGHSLIIGGLMSANELDNLSGIPGLMDLPILGKLFQFHSKSKTYGEVYIQITPYIVSDNMNVKDLMRQAGE